MKGIDFISLVFWPFKAVAFALFATVVLFLTLLCLAFSAKEQTYGGNG